MLYGQTAARGLLLDVDVGVPQVERSEDLLESAPSGSGVPSPWERNDQNNNVTPLHRGSHDSPHAPVCVTVGDGSPPSARTRLW